MRVKNVFAAQCRFRGGANRASPLPPAAATRDRWTMASGSTSSALRRSPRRPASPSTSTAPPSAAPDPDTSLRGINSNPLHHRRSSLPDAPLHPAKNLVPNLRRRATVDRAAAPRACWYSSKPNDLRQSLPQPPQPLPQPLLPRRPLKRRLPTRRHLASFSPETPPQNAELLRLLHGLARLRVHRLPPPQPTPRSLPPSSPPPPPSLPPSPPPPPPPHRSVVTATPPTPDPGLETPAAHPHLHAATHCCRPPPSATQPPTLPPLTAVVTQPPPPSRRMLSTVAPPHASPHSSRCFESGRSDG